MLLATAFILCRTIEKCNCTSSKVPRGGSLTHPLMTATCLHQKKTALKVSVTNFVYFLPNFSISGLFHLFISPAKCSFHLSEIHEKKLVMLVTTGIDIYTVDSRILYCGL